MTAPSILIAGDADMRTALAEQCALQGFAVSGASSAGEALAALSCESPRVLLLADDLPPPGSADLIERARAAGFTGSIILLALGAEPPPGADEVFARPFRFSALLDRLLALAEETPRESAASASFDAAALLPAGASARLTEKERAILDRLALENGAVTPREALLRDVWGYNPAVTTRTLETHIHRLRRKIEADPANPRLLLTEAGGYRLDPAARAGEGGENA